MNGLRLSRSRQIKARIFEVPGCGGFLMTQPADDLERYYTPGSEIETFDDPDELARKIGHYLAHPEERDRIALAGYARTRAEHTYEIRFSQLLEAANRLRKQETGGEKAVAVSNSVLVSEDFKKLELRHQTNFGLRLLRSLLTIPCCLVWGKQRGPRAARRILFEVSWRLCGETTYSAASWPGRIFYMES